LSDPHFFFFFFLFLSWIPSNDVLSYLSTGLVTFRHICFDTPACLLNYTHPPQWASSSRTTGRGSSSSPQQHVCSLQFILCYLFILSWSRELTKLTSSVTDQIGAAIQGFFWPKIFWDFLTKTLDGAVKPIPVLQIINLVFGLGMFALEWPLSFIAGSAIHRSLEVRLAILPLTALSAILMYQATNAALYYLIGMVVYFTAYSEGEVSL
jgi:hypothetical protein